MKILFAGGGTGGHLYTGIALAEEYQERGLNPADIVFVGTEYGLEKEIVPKNGYRLEYIPVKPLKGKGIAFRLKTLFQIPSSLLKSFQLLRREKPSLVFGIGGYASGPVVLMASFLRIPTAVLEQNSIPGITNRILGKFVDRIFICFEHARQFFKPRKTVFTGNPVRKNFFVSMNSSHLDRELGKDLGLGEENKSEKEFTLLVLGGSQGARSINRAVTQAAPLLKKDFRGLKILHQTGKSDLEEVKQAYQTQSIQAEVYDFVHNIHDLYLKADLIVCRSGAGTITELEILGKPAIFIPYPYAADDHQRWNALELVEQGAGRIILDRELSGERLYKDVKDLFSSPQALQEITDKIHRLAKPSAGAQILEVCKKIMQK